MVVRFSDWPMRLSAYLAEKQNEPFVWGSNDCLLFAAKAVQKLTGENFYDEYGSYSSMNEAYNLLLENGGIKGIISRALGASKRNVLSAQRGDVIIIKTPELVAGIVDDTGQRVAVLTLNGLTRMPLDKALRYWSY